jgi:hypothetical protein
MFLVSVASKGFDLSASGLESTLVGILQVLILKEIEIREQVISCQGRRQKAQNYPPTTILQRNRKSRAI